MTFAASQRAGACLHRDGDDGGDYDSGGVE